MRDPRHPPVLDMTPEGEFRQPPPPSKLDRFLARLGGVALLVTLAAGGLVLAAVAVFFAALLLPVVIVGGAIAAGTIWWRLRRAGVRPGSIRFVVRR